MRLISLPKEFYYVIRQKPIALIAESTTPRSGEVQEKASLSHPSVREYLPPPYGGGDESVPQCQDCLDTFPSQKP